MNAETLAIFLEGLKVLDIELSEYQLNQFSIYLDELKSWNEKFNLIGPASDSEIVKRHFLDSLSVLPILQDSSAAADTVHYSVLDIGTGAGFPGVPLKIVLSEISLTLVDSSRKKTEFLRHLCKRLNIKAEIICDRAENVVKLPEHRDGYDFVVARAVDKMSMIEGTALPFLNDKGALILQTGNKTDIELKNGEIMKKFKLPEEILPGRTVLLIRKKNQRPYPG